jgi:signal peptidase II
MSKRILIYFAIAILVVFFDQISKIWVHTHMLMGIAGEIPVFGDWFKLHYTLNPGMAFGLELGLVQGKLILSIFRLFAVMGIAFYLYSLAKQNTPKGLLVCIALILGGALGNVIDSTFYGVFLNNAPYDAITPWFHGQVIDMLYLDIWEGFLPDYLPFFGGKYYAFWPIFNIADASIFVGVLLILINQKKYFPA